MILSLVSCEIEGFFLDRKVSWPTLGHYCGSSLVRRMKTEKHFTEDNQCSGRDSNREPPRPRTQVRSSTATPTRSCEVQFSSVRTPDIGSTSGTWPVPVQGSWWPYSFSEYGIVLVTGLASELRRGADKSLALLICSTTKRNFLGWVEEIRTTKS
jgi:hypothetical protein